MTDKADATEAAVERIWRWLETDCAAQRRRAEAAEARVAELEATVAEVRARLLDPTAHVTEGPLIARIKVESWLRAILESGG